MVRRTAGVTTNDGYSDVHARVDAARRRCRRRRGRARGGRRGVAAPARGAVARARHRRRAGDIPDAAPRIACRAPSRRHVRGGARSARQPPAGHARRRHFRARDDGRAHGGRRRRDARRGGRAPTGGRVGRAQVDRRVPTPSGTDAAAAPIRAGGESVGAVVAFAPRVRAGLVRATGEVADWVAAGRALGSSTRRARLAELEVRRCAPRSARTSSTTRSTRSPRSSTPTRRRRASSCSSSRTSRGTRSAVPATSRPWPRSSVDRLLPEARARPLRRPPASRCRSPRGAVDV